jgi:hypothetical protein
MNLPKTVGVQKVMRFWTIHIFGITQQIYFGEWKRIVFEMSKIQDRENMIGMAEAAPHWTLYQLNIPVEISSSRTLQT